MGAIIYLSNYVYSAEDDTGQEADGQNVAIILPVMFVITVPLALVNLVVPVAVYLITKPIWVLVIFDVGADKTTISVLIVDRMVTDAEPDPRELRVKFPLGIPFCRRPKVYPHPLLAVSVMVIVKLTFAG